MVRIMVQVSCNGSGPGFTMAIEDSNPGCPHEAAGAVMMSVVAAAAMRVLYGEGGGEGEGRLENPLEGMFSETSPAAYRKIMVWLREHLEHVDGLAGLIRPAIAEAADKIRNDIEANLDLSDNESPMSAFMALAEAMLKGKLPAMQTTSASTPEDDVEEVDLPEGVEDFISKILGTSPDDDEEEGDETV